ncbi:tRNA (guanine(10)-N2)-methyltransferase-like [Porphyridium purpureum]|uniref:tRNA (Guanine(10)-N2)-methyltransferase-like n=1 Tax=Porphyridium purpureum TaxID=35688 RepID=A0A5J4Z2P4_PORPP|nr:tRNA (guanine(10)-N2)-methyltransferase-like [Porphyridium purpureum]|eukprot:POR1103..scf295_1
MVASIPFSLGIMVNGTVLGSFPAIMGRAGVKSQPDLFIGVLVALCTYVFFAAPWLALLSELRVRTLRLVSVALMSVWLAAMVFVYLTMEHGPYSQAAPKRMFVNHFEGDEHNALFVSAWDPIPLESMSSFKEPMASVFGMAQPASTLTWGGPMNVSGWEGLRPFSSMLDGVRYGPLNESHGLAPVRLRVLSDVSDTSNDHRRLELELSSQDSHQLMIRLDNCHILEWPYTPYVPRSNPHFGGYVIRHTGTTWQTPRAASDIKEPASQEHHHTQTLRLALVLQGAHCNLHVVCVAARLGRSSVTRQVEQLLPPRFAPVFLLTSPESLCSIGDVGRGRTSSAGRYGTARRGSNRWSACRLFMTLGTAQGYEEAQKESARSAVRRRGMNVEVVQDVYMMAMVAQLKVRVFHPELLDADGAMTLEALEHQKFLTNLMRRSQSATTVLAILSDDGTRAIGTAQFKLLRGMPPDGGSHASPSLRESNNTAFLFGESYRNSGGGCAMYVSSVAVCDSARRKGVASHIMHAITEQALELRRTHPTLRCVCLHVERHNSAARALYMRLGFRPLLGSSPSGTDEYSASIRETIQSILTELLQSAPDLARQELLYFDPFFGPFVRLVVVFRSPTRSTFGFDNPRSSLFSIACQEFNQRLLDEAGNDVARRFVRAFIPPRERLQDRQLVRFEVPYHLLEIVRRAASSCVLVHGVYQVLSWSSESHEESASKVQLAGLASAISPGDSFRVRSIVGRPDREGTETDSESSRIHDAYASHISAIQREFGARELRAGDVRASHTMVVLHFGHDRFFAFGRLLCRGPAAGHQDVLGLGHRSRRARSGILAKLALKDRPFCAPTTMEPELALLMASLALASPGKTVLDPFCGSCSLLLAASVQGAEYVVGVDVECGTSNVQGVVANFEQLGLRAPLLYEANVLDGRDRSPCFAAWAEPNTRYNCIISDPPYGMRAGVQVHDQDVNDDGPVSNDESPLYYQGAAGTATRRLCEIARDLLSVGGRLVCFVPDWRTSLYEFAPDVVLHDGLRLIACYPQVFSPTFRRWLVVIEKMSESKSN